ncbi:MAG: trehalose utilization protein [Planctomycetaceae bacterium]|nr:trehalose utilization protein [Planctomycetaceae bacterium]
MTRTLSRQAYHPVPRVLLVGALYLSVSVAWNVTCAAEETENRSIQVVIWDEQQPSQKRAYQIFLGEYLRDYLIRRPGLDVQLVTIDHPEKGLSKEVLDQCDVLVWWGHVRNGEVSVDEAKPIVDRIKQGKLGLLALHSAHWATPFVWAMHERAKEDAFRALPVSERNDAQIEFIGQIERKAPTRSASLTPQVKSTTKEDGSTIIRMTRPNCCFPAYKNHGLSSQITTRLPNHPIAAGIPTKFTLKHTEMYDEPFHVPTPDQVIFEERWEAGQFFRSGSVWKVGQGEVFYFRPGHETHAVYTEAIPRQIVENAIRWLGRDK